MIVPYGFIDIVIKRSSLEKIRKGLSNDFIKERKIKEGHFDENLIIIPGGMNPYDAAEEVYNLENKYKLVHIQDNITQDIVCVEPFGVCSKCGWLKVGTLGKEAQIGYKTYPKHFPYYEYTGK